MPFPTPHLLLPRTPKKMSVQLLHLLLASSVSTHSPTYWSTTSR